MSWTGRDKRGGPHIPISFSVLFGFAPCACARADSRAHAHCIYKVKYYYFTITCNKARTREGGPRRPNPSNRTNTLTETYMWGYYGLSLPVQLKAQVWVGLQPKIGGPPNPSRADPTRADPS